MPYDPSLDERVFYKTWESENSRLSVSIYSYNNGPKKLQLTRENKDREGNFKFTKLGRLNKEEVLALLPLIEESKSSLE